jgi:hypothetical protein
LAEYVKLVLEKNPSYKELPRFLFGCSMGGLITIQIAMVRLLPLVTTKQMSRLDDVLTHARFRSFRKKREWSGQEPS